MFTSALDMSFGEKFSESFDSEQQHVFVKFGAKLRWSASVIHKYLTQSDGQRALSLKTVEYWAIKFRKGDFNIKDQRGGDTSDSSKREARLDAIRLAMDECRHWCVRSLFTHLSIPEGTVKDYLKNELKMVSKILKMDTPRAD